MASPPTDHPVPGYVGVNADVPAWIEQLGLWTAKRLPRRVVDTDERDAIPAGDRYIGLLVHVEADGRIYSWDGSAWTVAIDGAAAIPKSTVTTKGDLLVATGANTVTRKAVGANGRVLAADSAQADGMAWVDTLTSLALGGTVWDLHQLNDTATSGTLALNFSAGRSIGYRANGNVTFSTPTWPGDATTRVSTMLLALYQEAAIAVTWFSGISWAYDTVPTLGGNGKLDLFAFDRVRSAGAYRTLGVHIGRFTP